MIDTRSQSIVHIQCEADKIAGGHPLSVHVLLHMPIECRQLIVQHTHAHIERDTAKTRLKSLIFLGQHKHKVTDSMRVHDHNQHGQHVVHECGHDHCNRLAGQFTVIQLTLEFSVQRCVDAENGVVKLFLFGVRPIGQNDNGQINGAGRCEC